MERIELVPKRGKLALLLLGSIAFVSLGILFLQFPQEFGGVGASRVDLGFLYVIGWVSILFFGACGIAIVKQLFDRRPRLILDDRGIFDRTLGTPLIPWSSIQSANIVQVRRTKFIALLLVDEEDRVAALPAAKRLVSAANRGLGFGRFNLSLSALDVPADQILQVIQEQIGIAGCPTSRF
jgi:hypothetical protein